MKCSIGAMTTRRGMARENLHFCVAGPRPKEVRSLVDSCLLADIRAFGCPALQHCREYHAAVAQAIAKFQLEMLIASVGADILFQWRIPQRIYNMTGRNDGDADVAECFAIVGAAIATRISNTKQRAAGSGLKCGACRLLSASPCAAECSSAVGTRSV